MINEKESKYLFRRMQDYHYLFEDGPDPVDETDLYIWHLSCYGERGPKPVHELNRHYMNGSGNASFHTMIAEMKSMNHKTTQWI